MGMTDRQSASQISENEASLSRLVHVFLGIYIWECVMFLDVDWRCVRYMKRRQPEMTLGFVNRYVLLAVLIGFIVNLNDTIGHNCRPLHISTNLCSSIAVGLASIGLTLRVVAVWGRCQIIPVTVLFVCLLVQASLFLQAPIVGCVITSSGNLTPILGYTFNTPYFFILLASAGWVYLFPCKKVPLRNRISLMELCCFGAAFVASLVNTVFIRLNLNPVMAVIAIVPSTVIISIASGRVIRSGGESSRAFIRPKAAEQQSAATQYPAHKQTRLSLRQWPSNSGSPRREAFDPLKVHRLRLPSTLHANTVQATNSTRSSSITLPSLNPPPSIYIPNRASQNPSTHLDSDSETSTKGDCYDLDAQLIAVERRNPAGTTSAF
ncbi:hypothetical protein AB1N83_006555 [Pleurotus pulmonarius]